MWNIYTNEPYLNAAFIFPTKQREVGVLVKYAEADSNVLKMVIFGSSVTSACNPWSDIDVYYLLKEDKEHYSPVTKSAIDEWTNFSISKEEKLYDEIKKKGVMVYDRDITR